MQESKWYCGVCNYEAARLMPDIWKHMRTEKHTSHKPRKGSEAMGSSEIGEWCRSHGWRTITDVNAKGTEDQCFILFRRPMTPIYPEYIGRAKNLIIIVTTLHDTLGGL